MDLVANCERKSVWRNSMLVDDKDPFDNDEVDPLLHDILKALKMKPLGDKAKKYCREGHLLERPFLEQFHKHCLDENINTCGYNSVAIHETLVGKFVFVIVLYCIVLYCIVSLFSNIFLIVHSYCSRFFYTHTHTHTRTFS